MRHLRNDILSVRIATTAWRQLGVVPSDTFARIKSELYTLAENPSKIPGNRAAADKSTPLYFMVDDFVAMYSVDPDARLITLLEVAQRLNSR